MTIAREEIFGPCFASSRMKMKMTQCESRTILLMVVGVCDVKRQGAGVRVAKRIRAGNVHINGARVDFGGCFGGYKQSGNGREWGEAGWRNSWS